MSETTATIQISQNGPYIVSGGLPLCKVSIAVNAEGESVSWQQGKEYPLQESYALCRCGHSQNKPFCDGHHVKVSFDGTETASRQSYVQQAKVFQGPTRYLTDATPLCSSARFCDPHGTVWKSVGISGQAEAGEHFVAQVGLCPSGRLGAWDKETGQPIEPQYPVSIAVVEDPSQHCAGPLWVRGGVTIIAGDGFAYEIRNRVTLCRCGASKNKPFCDGTHISIGFQDEK